MKKLILTVLKLGVAAVAVVVAVKLIKSNDSDNNPESNIDVNEDIFI